MEDMTGRIFPSGEGELPRNEEPEVEILDDLEGSPSSSEEQDMARKIELLEKELETAKKEKEALQEEAARARADYYNLRQRTARDASRQRALASETAVQELLPVLDNLDRALTAASQDDPLLKGVSMVRRQFFEALRGLGLEEVASLGNPFDPACHEAVGMDPVEDPGQDGMVLAELQKGYVLGGRVLRASQVRIGTYAGENA